MWWRQCGPTPFAGIGCPLTELSSDVHLLVGLARPWLCVVTSSNADEGIARTRTGLVATKGPSTSLSLAMLHVLQCVLYVEMRAHESRRSFAMLSSPGEPAEFVCGIRGSAVVCA